VGDVRIDPNGTPGWATVNVAAEWRLRDRWLLTARLENLFDRRYRSHGSGIDAVGRNVFLSVRSSW
jgi:outer membrane receptor protein involved in Fe transport